MKKNCENVKNDSVVKPSTFVAGKFWVEIGGKKYTDFYSIKHGNGFASVDAHTDYPSASYEFEYIDLETAFTHNEFDNMDGFFLDLDFEEFDGTVEDDTAGKLLPREENYYISHVHSFVKDMDKMGIGTLVYRFILEGGLSTYGKCIKREDGECSDKVYEDKN